MDSERMKLIRALSRRNALALSTAIGLLCGGGIFLATVILVLKGGPNPGPMLSHLRFYMPGFAVTWGGAFLGLFWGFLEGFVLSLPSAWLYYAGVERSIHRSPEARAGQQPLSRRPIHILFFATSFGLLFGIALLLATLWLVVTHKPGTPLGPNLMLLNQYLPGFRVSIAGGILGGVYGAVIGCVFFAAVGALYNVLLGRRNGRDVRPKSAA